MRLLLSVILCMLFAGCVVLPGWHRSRITSGHKYGGAALAFLDEAGATRAEVIATLGVPSNELKEAGVLVYTWTTSNPYIGLYALSPIGDEVIELRRHGKNFKETVKIWALFVTYDSKQTVTGHAIRSFPDGSNLKTEAFNWATSKSK